MSYFFAATYKDPEANIDELLDFLGQAQVPADVEFQLGMYLDTSIIRTVDKSALREAAFKKIAATAHVRAEGHYTILNSIDIAEDMHTLPQVFPSMGSVQINELQPQDWRHLKELQKDIRLLIAINDANRNLVSDTDFQSFVKEREAFLIFDNSGGRGQSQTFEYYCSFIDECIAAGIQNLAVAGGFGPDSLDSYFKLRKRYNQPISIDAESKLQTNGTLDQRKARSYFEALLALT